jgi:hypothetical protein
VARNHRRRSHPGRRPAEHRRVRKRRGLLSTVRFFLVHRGRRRILFLHQYSDLDATINVTWNIAYQLITEGKASAASVGTTYSEKDVTSGLVLIQPTSWTGFAPPSAKNGEHVEGVQLGSFGVIVPAESTTDLHIEVVMSALAINVPTPDPSSLLLSGSGLTVLLGFYRSVVARASRRAASTVVSTLLALDHR